MRPLPMPDFRHIRLRRARHCPCPSPVRPSAAAGGSFVPRGLAGCRDDEGVQMTARKVRTSLTPTGAAAAPRRAGRSRATDPPKSACAAGSPARPPRSRQAAKTTAPGGAAVLREDVARAERNGPERRRWTDWDYAAAAGVVAVAIAPVPFLWAPPFWILALMCSSDRPPGRRRAAATGREGAEPGGKHR